MEENIQFVSIPNTIVKVKKLKPSVILVYAFLRRYMNKDTKQSYPSYQTLCEKTTYSKVTIGKAIKKLVSEELISVDRVPNKDKQGSHNVYTFTDPDNDGFERFNFKFLDREDLNASEKAAYCMQQFYMFKDEEKKEGNVYYSDKKLSETLGVSRDWLAKQNNSMEEKGLIKIEPTKDEITGIISNVKRFQLSKLDQAFICVIKNINDRTTKNEDDIALLKKKIQQLELENEEFKKKLNVPDKYVM